MTEQSRPKPIELVARAIYAKIPTFQIVRRPTTEATLRYEEVRIDDTWEEADDRHGELMELAQAAFDILIKHGCISIEGIIARDEEMGTDVRKT